MNPLERIIEQAQKGLADEPIAGLEDLPLGMFGLTTQQLRFGNIIAIAKNAVAEAYRAGL